MGSPTDELTDGKLRGDVNSIVERASLRYGFIPIVFGADRHGSFVWEATRRDGTTRSITVSSTPQGNAVLAEAWATATDGSRFARRPSTTQLVNESAFDSYVHDGNDGLRRLILRTADVANHLNDEDLSERYSVAAQKAP